MIYPEIVQDAMEFADKAHSDQDRKVSGTPYVTHLYSVAILLARAGAGEETIAAGLLHDVIEDTSGETSVTEERIADRFGRNVAELVHQMTERDRSLPWEERKRRARLRIQEMDKQAMMVKSADLLHNLVDMIRGYRQNDDEFFAPFNAGPEDQIHHYRKSVQCLEEQWQDNPFLPELKRYLDTAISLWGPEQ